MTDKIFSRVKLVAVAMALICVSCGSSKNAAGNIYIDRAVQTMESVYQHYSSKGTMLLRENYPFDETYKAGYLASEEQATEGNAYSYLWPFSGSLSAGTAILESHPEWADTLKNRVLPGLKEYYDSSRQPSAYSSYIASAEPSDRFYDDNIWLGIDFTDLYSLTGNQEYLDTAKVIWRFIESGMDDKLGGGIYWCEQKKHSKNTCSNAPGAVLALKLFNATNDEKYLQQGISLYAWTREHLLDTTDNLYLDNINLSGKIQDWKFAYNSGQMIQAATLLYNATSEKHYLQEARLTAAACYNHFFEDYTRSDGSVVKILKKGNVWFSAIMVRGLEELYKIDGNATYLNSVRNTLDLAWEHGRSPEGFFGDDYSGKRNKKQKWLLTQGAMAEMFARIAKFEN